MKTTHLEGNETEIEVVIIQKRDSAYSDSYIAKYRNEKIIIQSSVNYSLSSGTTVKLIGVLKKPVRAHIPNAFDYHNYLQTKGIYYIFEAESIEVVQKTFHHNQLNEWVIDYFNRYPLMSKTYLCAFLLGNSQYFDSNTKESISKLGISHLFAISGLHITILVTMLRKALKYTKLSKNKIELFIITFLLMYMIISSLMISIIRATLMEIGKNINERFNFGLTSLDILSILFVGLILINPFHVHQIGFQLSFLVSFTLMIGNRITSRYQHWLMQSFLVCMLAFLSSFLVIINISYEINIWAIFVNIIFVYFVGTFILPFTFLVAIYFPLHRIYEPIISLYDWFTKKMANLFYYSMPFSTPSLIVAFIFVILTYRLFMLIETKKVSKLHLVIYVLFLGIWSATSSISFVDAIYFLAVSNGDATVIKESFGRCTMVIDTGEGRKAEVTNFLKSIGVKQIDYLIITHGDLDHIGEAKSLIQHFKVKTIIFNEYDNTNDVRSIIEANRSSKVMRLKQNDLFTCGSNQFRVLGPTKNWNDTNQNSLILMGEVFGESILFTGDIGSKVEENLTQTYTRLKFDILKVAHHGSNTSTSTQFLDGIQFKEAIIMNGINNRFNFPHQQVITRLHSHIVYRTDVHDTIIMKKYWYQTNLKKPIV